MVEAFTSTKSYDIKNALLDFTKLRPSFILELFFAANPTLVRDLKITDFEDLPNEWALSGRFYHFGKSFGVPYRVFTAHLKGLVSSHSVEVQLDPGKTVDVPKKLENGELMKFSRFSIKCCQSAIGNATVTIDVAIDTPCKLPTVLEELPRQLFIRASKGFINLLRMTSV